MAKEETRNIILAQDGTATYERRLRVNGKPDQPARERVMETKRVDAAALIPDYGELMVLPTNCRFMRSEEGTAVFVTEEPPALRTVTWHTDVGDTDYYEAIRERLRRSQHHRLLGLSKQEFGRLLKTQQTFRLAFPYIIKIYVFNQRFFKGGWLYFRTQPLTSERDGLLVSCLPNLQVNDGHMCLTDRVRAMAMGDMNYAQYVDAVELEFWSSPWNDHWIETFHDYAKRVPEIASPWEWEYNSRVDSSFILRLPWRGWETTVGEQVRIRLANRAEDTDTFKYFETRVRTAEAYEIKPAVTVGATKPSPLQRLFLNDGVILAIGDQISFRRRTFDSIATDRKYEIEWFGRMDRNGNRNVKLKDVEKPLPLVTDGLLHSVVQIAPPAAPPPMELTEGVMLGQGSILRFKSNNDWGDLENRYFAIEEARRGPRGVILVRLAGKKEPIPVGEFEELYPGVRLLAGKNGEEQTIELDDGTVLAVGDELAYYDGRTYAESIIKSFTPVGNGVKRRILVMENGRELEAETDKGTFGNWFAKTADCRKTEITVGKTVIRPGDSFKWPEGNLTIDALAQFGPDRSVFGLKGNKTWIMLAMNGKFVQGVKPVIKPKLDGANLVIGHETYEPGYAFFDKEACRVRVAASYGIRIWSSVALVEANGKEIEFAKDGEMVNHLERVDLTLQLPDGREIHRGQRLRLTTDIQDFKAGKRFAVSHIQRDGKKLVVLSEGLGFEATAENLTYFEERRGTEWRLLADLPEKPAPKPRKKVHPKFGERCAVRYLGGDASNRFIELGSEETAKTLPAKIVDWRSEDLAKVDFGQRFPGTHCGNCGNCGGSCAWISTKYLVKNLGGLDGPALMELERVFYKHGGGARFVQSVGMIVARDAGETPIRIGDRVKIRNIGNPRGLPNSEVEGRYEKGQRKFLAGAAFTVVHAGDNSAGTWLYLDAGEDVGSPDRSRDDLIGLGEIPSELRQDKTWWARLIYVLSHCVVVEQSKGG
ncbi:hypothetical protein HZC53_00645 [Candidatus Uhrbacteria bacterium]|nr:hypothetical protein [Candidatus Uhrbacteria bacterium]